MRRDWKAFFKNKNNFVILLLIGVLFLVMLIPVGEETNQEDGTIGGLWSQGSYSQAGGGNGSNSELLQTNLLGDTLNTTQAYCTMLEEKLASLLSQIEGVGKTKVMISMQYSEEKFVETQDSTQTQETTETDSAGGTRVISSVSEDKSTVYESTGGNSIPYVIKTEVPKVQGVFVIAEGAGVGDVDLKITQIVQALLAVDVHKIAIAKMEAQ